MKKYLLAFALMVFAAGCDDEKFNHDPPAGMGCIIVNNNTSHDIRPYINGLPTNTVSDYDWEAYDLKPGLYRVVLDDKESSRNFRDDIDVMENKRTILDVTTDPVRPNRFDVYVYFD